jgi:hypothetical protein
MSYPSSRTPLLAVHDLREEIHAGSGSTFACVRTLDGVSLTVHAGDLVVVQGGVASGAASLIAAIVGARRTARGARHTMGGLQIRRGRIDHTALRALQAAWPRPRQDERPDPTRTPVLYVLRVRPATSPSTRPAADGTDAGTAFAHAWRTWCAALRKRGGSVLVHVATASDVRSRRTDAPRPQFVSEAPSLTDSSWREDEREPRAVRVLTFDAGRIVSADPARRRWSSA